MEEIKKQQVPKIEIFKGKPVLTLNPEDKWPFSFGVAKAKIMMQNLDAIKAFIAAHDQSSSHEN